jgi:hypothetical protein
MAIHVVSQDDLISIAQFDLDQHQNISSPQTECNSLLSLCPYIKHIVVVESAELGVEQAVEVSGGKESGPHQDSLMIRRTRGGTGVIWGQGRNRRGQESRGREEGRHRTGNGLWLQ